MKRNLILIVAIFLGIILLMITGNIIIIGEKIAQLTHLPYLEYVFYGIITIALFCLIILPIIRVHLAPAFPTLGIDEEMDEKKLKEFGNLLADNCNYIPKADGQRNNHQHQLKLDLLHATGDTTQLKAVLKKELDLRLNGDKSKGVIGINQLIKDWGKTVFMVTAVSQNSKLDTLGMLFMNYKMIENIILASGFRPSNRQLFRLYANIIVTSVLTYAISESLTNIGDVAPFDIGSLDGADSADVIDGASDGGLSLTNALKNFKIPGIVVSSAADGGINLLLTLRIGYITRGYLQKGSKQLKGIQNKRMLRLDAMKEAFKTAPAIVAEGTAEIGKKAGSFAMDMIKS